MAGKNISLFLDGTWNKPKTNTNVYKVAKSYVAAKDKSGTAQRAFYDAGVGTKGWNKLRGGAFGNGIEKNIRESYSKLSEVYEDGDKIFIFGFSRGAYTARSIAGMIVRYGLLKPNSELSVKKIFKIYAGTDKQETRQISTINRLSDTEKQNLNSNERLVMKHSRRVDIQFLGLYDTVGALGLPVGEKLGVNDEHKFHHRGVSSLFKNVAHAVSVDEKRKFYKPTMFFKYAPDDEPADKTAAEISKWNKRIEQRWFCGSHGCVGGSTGGDIDKLTLEWILTKAKQAGLVTTKGVPLNGSEGMSPFKDSFGFLYKTGLLGKKHFRPIGREPAKGEGYTLHCLNEQIDKSVFDRCRTDKNYRPKNLVDWAQKNGVDLATATGDKPV